MTTDRELLALAAKAGGGRLEWHDWGDFGEHARILYEGEICAGSLLWNSLQDAGDALRLLGQLRKLHGPILLALFEDRVECGDESIRHACVPIVDGNIDEAICRVITLAAAEIGKRMP